MTQLNPGEMQEVFTQRRDSLQIVTFGYKLIIFVGDIPADKLVPLIHPETKQILKDFAGNELKGTGVVFYNPADMKYQGMPIRDEEGNLLKSCLIFPLGDEIEGAKVKHGQILEKIHAVFPKGFSSAADITEAAKLGAEITKDVYNSDEGWFHLSTKTLSQHENAFFVEAKGTKAEAYYLSGKVTIGADASDAQAYPDGAVILKDSQGEVRGCHPDEFGKLYRRPSLEGLELVGATDCPDLVALLGSREAAAGDAAGD